MEGYGDQELMSFNIAAFLYLSAECNALRLSFCIASKLKEQLTKLNW